MNENRCVACGRRDNVEAFHVDMSDDSLGLVEGHVVSVCREDAHAARDLLSPVE